MKKNFLGQQLFKYNCKDCGKAQWKTKDCICYQEKLCPDCLDKAGKGFKFPKVG